MSAFTQRHNHIRDPLSEGQQLKREVREAIAWGRSDSESVGLSADKFISLLHQCLRHIEFLEGKLE